MSEYPQSCESQIGIEKPMIAEQCRSPWTALTLSLLCAGVGHVYCGKAARGLVIYCAWFLLPVAVVLAATLPPSRTVLFGLVLLPVIALFVLYWYAAANAWRAARQSREVFRLQDYNRPALYALLIVVGLIYPVGIISGLRQFVFEAFVVPTASMCPTILPGDRVLVNKLIWNHSLPRRGELVVFRDPGSGANVFIKRVVAVAGDTIAVRNGVVWVNDQPLPRERIAPEWLPDAARELCSHCSYETNAGRRYLISEERPTDSEASIKDMPVTNIPPRTVFVLGDNRRRSKDSRVFGFVHVGDILGLAQYLYIPAGSWSRFGKIEP